MGHGGDRAAAVGKTEAAALLATAGAVEGGGGGTHLLASVAVRLLSIVDAAPIMMWSRQSPLWTVSVVDAASGGAAAGGCCRAPLFIANNKTCLRSFHLSLF